MEADFSVDEQRKGRFFASLHMMLSGIKGSRRRGYQASCFYAKRPEMKC